MRLLLFPLLRVLLSPLRPEDAKLHLASWNGTEDPLDVYAAGNFDAWQEVQTKPNFNRPMVVSLIALPERHHWLFVGVYAVTSAAIIDVDGHFRYELAVRDETAELSGRLIVAFERPGRQSYLKAECWQQNIAVVAIRPERYQIAGFTSGPSERFVQ